MTKEEVNEIDSILETIRDLDTDSAEKMLMALKSKALAEVEKQEPVAWEVAHMDGSAPPPYIVKHKPFYKNDSKTKVTPLYTHPAPSWQGLSDDEIEKIDDETILATEFARAIEQALKEKRIMTKDEALKMAIEALWLSREHIKLHQGTNNVVDATDKALNACKEALEQPAQEPAYQVGEIVNPYGSNIKIKQPAQEPVAWGNPTYNYAVHHKVAPSWQGLSDDEIEQAILSKNKAGEWWGMCLDIARAIEQALKEKNT